MDFKRIVVGTDFSAASSSALEAAKDLAQTFGAVEVVIAHVYELPAVLVPASGMGVAPSLQAEIERDLKAALEDLRMTYFGDVPGVRTELLAGASASTELCRFAERLPADLVVVATHGRTGFARLLVGSVAKRVVQYSSCAVLTVRAR